MLTTPFCVRRTPTMETFRVMLYSDLNNLL